MRRAALALLVLLSSLLVGCAGASTSSSVRDVAATPWLEGLHEGDILTYRVTLRDGRSVKAQLRVTRLVRRGGGVAVRLEPTSGGPQDVEWEGRWIAGDASGLRDLGDPEVLRDPGLVPLDDAGHVVIPTATADRAATIDWALRLDVREGEEMGRGWAIDELDLEVDGPVRGEHCARLVRREGTRTAQLVVCANLGVVQREVREEGISLLERWTLVAVGGNVLGEDATY